MVKLLIEIYFEIGCYGEDCFSFVGCIGEVVCCLV